MDLIPQVPKIRMVEGVPYKLRTWWESFDAAEKLSISRRLRFLTSLFQISPDKHIIRALILFWDPDRVVFVIKDFELTPTLEETYYFTDLKYQGKGQIIPHSQSRKKFLRYLGLKNTKELRSFDHNWISLDYLYERYGRRDGHELFRKEFSCTSAHWRVRRPITFVVALLGTLIFPREHRKISTCISSVDRALFEGVEGAQLTLVPMMLAEIFRALGKCKRGETNFFEGCNLLLQMWAMEYFYQRENMVDIMFSMSNKINTFYDRMKRFVSPVGTDDWYEFLFSRTSDQVQWKYPLLSCSTAYIRCRRLYCIKIIGLEGLQPYAPVRVLRQFGQAQVIPLRANMRVSEIPFGSDFRVPRARQILHEWNNIITIEVGDGPPEGIPEYQAWVREDHGNINPSPEGEQGFEDIGTMIWIRHVHLGTTMVTPEIWSQMENMMQYLENAGAGPSNVGASSSLPPTA